MFVRSYSPVLEQKDGASFEAEGYTFALQGMQVDQLNVSESGAYDEQITLVVDLKRGERTLSTLRPKMTYPQQLAQEGQSTRHVAIHSELLKDVFVSFEGYDETNVAMTIKFFPMQSWVWVGFAITILGSGLAAWPKKQRLAA
jgi:cytochrome c biogenesis factor